MRANQAAGIEDPFVYLRLDQGDRALHVRALLFHYSDNAHEFGISRF
jgi:hypothetical protein